MKIKVGLRSHFQLNAIALGVVGRVWGGWGMSERECTKKNP
ncbi:MAG: hypothetical protein RMX89_33930 [Nostoc sp. DedSLP04]|nr:hypothetical protein [Nostoc sp. DedSLP04]